MTGVLWWSVFRRSIVCSRSFGRLIANIKLNLTSIKPVHRKLPSFVPKLPVSKLEIILSKNHQRNRTHFTKTYKTKPGASRTKYQSPQSISSRAAGERSLLTQSTSDNAHSSWEGWHIRINILPISVRQPRSRLNPSMRTVFSYSCF